MKLLTAKQMRELDRLAIEVHGIPSLDLMERAGAGVAREVIGFVDGDDGEVVIVVGPGNNGGDGLVAARHLLTAGYEVSVLMLASSSSLSPDSRANWERLAPMTTKLFTVEDALGLVNYRPAMMRASCIVDAVLGTGLNKDVRGLAASAIDAMNSSGAPIVAVDIPSGLSADTGFALGRAIIAEITVTFGLPKVGLALGEGSQYAGRTKIIDIGIPEELSAKVESKLSLVEPSMFDSVLNARATDSHKGTFGHVVIFAGSRGHLGAGYLSSIAALRSGCGLATYCLPQAAFVRFDARYPEIMCETIPDGGSAIFAPQSLAQSLELAQGKSAVAIGPAIGTEKETRAFVNEFIRAVEVPLVVDADALNVLDLSVVRSKRSPVVLTPHPGEMARLMGVSTADVQSNRITIASQLSKKGNAVVVLKGHDTIIAFPDGRCAINPTGNAGMATAGMGDALTGVISSFIAQGIDIEEAVLGAVYLHGLAGDIAAGEHTQRALITSDVIKCLEKAFRNLES
jgi:ADP-dependent NAD(P)H-hydrate dehydratase / NAD(P)H-hydrate epimerase